MTNFTAYISPYLVLNNGGYYTKHIYMGSQRIASKLGSSDIFSASPLTAVKAYSKDFTAKYADLAGKIKTRYDSLGVTYPVVPDMSFIKIENGCAGSWDLQIPVTGMTICAVE